MSDSTAITFAGPEAVERAHPERHRRPAELLAAPVVVLCLLALVVNDHWLKAAHTSWLTGKISDVAGLVVAPVLLLSLAETVAWLGGRTLTDSNRLMRAAAGAVGIAFAAIQLVPAAAGFYSDLAGHTASFVAALVPFVSSGGGPANVTADPTDLIALVALAVPIRLSHD